MTRRIALALVVVGAVAALVGVVLWRTDDGSSVRRSGGTSRSSFLSVRGAAVAPFAGLTQARLGVGSKCLRVVVADDESERVAGLRGRSDLGPYDGMLFVFPEPVDTAFTMSTVPVPLDIGFYSAGGDLVGTRHMKPCPKAEADCPVYRAGREFSYALEAERGDLPAGSLAPCPS